MGSKIILQNAAGAFLKNRDKYLLMLRASGREIAPGLWSCVGGHMEASELNDPMEACFREIKEETGIPREKIFNLKLRYIIFRQNKNVIRQNYLYFGETSATELIGTEEGTLHWIPENELLEREYTKTYMKMMRHYKETPDPEERIIVGIAGRQSGSLLMNWSILEDFE